MNNNQEIIIPPPPAFRNKSVFMICHPEKIDFKKELNRVAEKIAIIDSTGLTYYKDRVYNFTSSVCHSVYGVILHDRLLKLHNIKEQRTEKVEYFSKHVTFVSNSGWYKVNEKNGIEVLGMKPDKTKDGKYRYDGVSIGELKKICKANGLKGYSKLDKCGLVKLLMKV